MSPILKLEALTTPTAVFVGIARSKRSSKCRIMPSNRHVRLETNLAPTAIPLNQKDELVTDLAKAASSSSSAEPEVVQ